MMAHSYAVAVELDADPSLAGLFVVGYSLLGGTDALGAQTRWATVPAGDVYGVSIRRGRSDDTREYDAGTCVIELANDSGDYDPDNANGLYVSFGVHRLTIGTGVRVTLTPRAGGTGQVVFHGRVADFILDHDDHRPTVTLECEDRLADLGRAPIPPMAEGMGGDTTAERAAWLLDAAGVPAAYQDVAGDRQLLAWEGGGTAREALERLARGEGGRFRVTRAGVAVLTVHTDEYDKVASVAFTDAPEAAPVVASEYAWADEFTGTALDEAKWTTFYYWAGHRWHLDARYEVNLAGQVTVHDGAADIRTQRVTTADPYTSTNYPFRSGVLSTGTWDGEGRDPRFVYKYGRLDVRMMFPVGAGPYWSTDVNASKIWPAIWMMPYDSRGSSSSWPEIDIMEVYGDSTRASWNILAGGSSVANGVYPTTEYGGGWHVWTFDWTPTAMSLYVDGVLEAEVTSSVPAIPYYLIINTAVGYNPGFGPPDAPGTPADAHTYIDYVRLTANAHTVIGMP